MNEQHKTHTPLIKDEYEIDDLSIATALVVDIYDNIKHYIAFGGDVLNQDTPDTMTIHGKTYQIIQAESTDNKGNKILADRYISLNTNQTNHNHAEKKLMSFITTQNKDGKIKEVEIAIQNSSNAHTGICYGCGGIDGMGGTIAEFARLNPNIKISIMHE